MMRITLTAPHLSHSEHDQSRTGNNKEQGTNHSVGPIKVWPIRAYEEVSIHKSTAQREKDDPRAEQHRYNAKGETQQLAHPMHLVIAKQTLDVIQLPVVIPNVADRRIANPEKR